mgnify:CR=1 FL=1
MEVSGFLEESVAREAGLQTESEDRTARCRSIKVGRQHCCSRKSEKFLNKFKFIDEFDNIGDAGFQKCRELSVEVANVQYFESGSLILN